MDTLAPTISGKPGSVCITAPSCTLLLMPMLMISLSPRRVAPNHTLLWSARTALPMTEALGATYALIAIVGAISPNLYKAIFNLRYRSVRMTEGGCPRETAGRHGENIPHI